MRENRKGWPDPVDNELGRLLEQAGSRSDPPADDLATIRASAHREWRRLIARRGQRRRLAWGLGLVAAAALVVVVAAPRWGSRTSPEGGEIVASVERIGGRVLVAGKPLVEGDPIARSTVLDTATCRLALRLRSGIGVRLDHGTRLRLISPTDLFLEQGAVYVDTDGAAERTDGVGVRTPLGDVFEVGTRFEVRLQPGIAGPPSVRVRVREGLVRVEQGTSSYRAEGGVELAVSEHRVLERAAVPPFGEPWSWTLETAPRFEIEGRSLAEFLRWVSRETGWETVYEGAAESIVLHGSIAGLSPDRAPEVVLPGCGIDHRLVEGRLILTDAE